MMLKFQLFIQKGRNKIGQLAIPIWFNPKIYLYAKIIIFLYVHHYKIDGKNEFIHFDKYVFKNTMWMLNGTVCQLKSHSGGLDIRITNICQVKVRHNINGSSKVK